MISPMVHVEIAKGTAYVRGFCDIPFASEISLLVGAKKANKKIMGGGFESIKSFIPLIEFSYKAINAAVKERKVKKILEIAAGFSPRGLEFLKNRNIIYVECDLPPVIRAKKIVYRKISAKKYNKFNNLYLIETDILDQAQLLDSIRFFKKGPITIISEGLLAYLTNRQKKNLTRNIHKILSYYGGIWITSDFPVMKRIQFESGQDENVSRRFKKISNVVDINIKKNYFKDEKEFLSFFHVNGFNCKFLKINILKKIKSAKLSGMSQREINLILRKRKILILTPNNNLNENCNAIE